MVVPKIIDGLLDPSERVGDRFDGTNVDLVAGNRRVLPNIFEDDLLDPSECVGDRFDRTNVELVALNSRVIPIIIGDDLLRLFEQIDLEPVAGTRVVARGVP